MREHAMRQNVRTCAVTAVVLGELSPSIRTAQKCIELPILDGASTISVEEIKSGIEGSLVCGDRELVQRLSELSFVYLAAVVGVKVSEGVDHPVEVLCERHLELPDNAVDLSLHLRRQLDWLRPLARPIAPP